MNIVLGALTFSASEGGHARIKEKQQQRKESQFNYSFFSWKDVPPHLPNPLFCRFNNFCVCVRCWKHNLKVTTLLKYDKQVNLGTNMSNLLVTKATFSNSISVSWTEQISEVHSDGFWAQEGLKMEFFCCWRCEEEEEIMLRSRCLDWQVSWRYFSSLHFRPRWMFIDPRSQDPSVSERSSCPWRIMLQKSSMKPVIDRCYITGFIEHI